MLSIDPVSSLIVQHIAFKIDPMLVIGAKRVNNAQYCQNRLSRLLKMKHFKNIDAVDPATV